MALARQQRQREPQRIFDICGAAARLGGHLPERLQGRGRALDQRALAKHHQRGLVALWHLGQRLAHKGLGPRALRKRDRVRAVEQKHGGDSANRPHQLRAGQPEHHAGDRQRAQQQAAPEAGGREPARGQQRQRPKRGQHEQEPKCGWKDEAEAGHGAFQR